MSDRNLPQLATRLLKGVEVCEVLRVQPRTLRRWQQRGIIPFLRIGRDVRFQPADIAAVIARARVDNSAAALPVQS